ncbi:pentapeptide repeat-containing protein [Corynebacterium kalidii]
MICPRSGSSHHRRHQWLQHRPHLVRDLATRHPYTLPDTTPQPLDQHGLDREEPVIARSTDFRGANMSAVTASGSVFTDCDFRGADFTNADLRDVDFTGSTIDGANFSGAHLAGATGLQPSTETNSPMITRGLFAHTIEEQLSAAQSSGTSTPQASAPAAAPGPETDTGPGL